jgi:hypothetical protein
MIPEENDSTQNRPIANFEYLFQYDGFIDLRQRFMNSDGEYDAYDPNTDTKTSRYLNEGTLEFYYPKETFMEHYGRLLNKQYGLSCKNIDNHYYELSEDDEIKRFLKRTLSSLDYLLTEVENSNDLNVFVGSKEVLNKLIKFIHNKYEEFLPKGVIVEPDTVTAINIDGNPYPRIFSNDNAYNKFKSLLEVFGRGNKNLANYSFIFHRMKKDLLLFEGLKQIEFIDMLSSFDIHLDRLKPQGQLGNIDYREGIYNRG